MKKITLVLGIYLAAFINSQSAQAKLIVSIEGTTGSGKSTLVKILQEELVGVELVPEPVGMIQDVEGKGNLLELYYHNAHRWSFTAQTYFFLTGQYVFESACRNSCCDVLISDRSIYATFYVFGKLLHYKKMMSDIEWVIYKKLFDALERGVSYHYNAIIYLRTSPEECYCRIKKRNRAEEMSAPFDYYLREFNLHEKWLMQNRGIRHDSIKNLPLLVLNGDVDFLHDIDARQILINQIKEFITTLKNNSI